MTTRLESVLTVLTASVLSVGAFCIAFSGSVPALAGTSALLLFAVLYGSVTG